MGKDLNDLMWKLKDREWRLSNLYKIVDKNGRRVTFTENDIQRKIRINPARRKRILKARQFGVSTGCIIEKFDKTIWNDDVTTCLIAHEQDSIKKIFRIVTRAYKFLPDEIRPQLDRGGGSKYELFFPEINSRIYCDLESRGDTIQNLHISEAAFVQDPNRIRATKEAVPLTGEITEETTPNGMGNHFYDEWMDPTSQYANLFFPWYSHAEYQIPEVDVGVWTPDEEELREKAKRLYQIELTDAQIAFRRFKKSDSRELFVQEYPEDDQTCFLASGESVMDLVVVKELLSIAPKPIEDDGLMKIYKRVDRNGLYVIGADTSEGCGGDASAACVFEARTREQVATLRGQMKPSDFAHKLEKLASKYITRKEIWPLVAVERNNHGHAVLLELDEHIKYRNLFKAKDERVGWVTDRITRPIMLNALIDAVEGKNFKFNDRVTLQECLTLVNENGKIQAAVGKHDDTIIAAAIGLQMCVELGGLELYSDIKNKILV